MTKRGPAVPWRRWDTDGSEILVVEEVELGSAWTRRLTGKVEKDDGRWTNTIDCAKRAGVSLLDIVPYRSLLSMGPLTLGGDAYKAC
jgi:hypothetical protein